MEFALMIEGQEGVSWSDWTALADAVEANGFDALFRSDHYVGLMGDETRGSLDAWATLNALAAVTDRIRLGTLVSPVTFRHPSLLFKNAVTADHVSGGRIEVGMGAGWNEREHEAYGFDFPETDERYDLFEESVEIVRRLLTEEEVSHDGPRFTLSEVKPLPRPVQDPPPLVIGGSGGPRSLSIAARFADEYNTLGASLDDVRDRRGRFVDAWEEAGRDGHPRFSVMVPVLVGGSDDEVRARAEVLLDRLGRDADAGEFIEERRDKWALGTPQQVADTIGQLGDAGVDRVMLQHLVHTDLDSVSLIGEEVIPAVG
ncbi:MAG: LLM class flavin-dependent oxidoreductase [Nitriliruptorales bacterium]|nr:LLM class flavin-dependent oxidoreductase [Nitriliruptorales bacterium]